MAQRGRIIIISENEGQSTLECRSTPFCFCAIDMMWMLSLDDVGGDLTVFKGIQVASVCAHAEPYSLPPVAGGAPGLPGTSCLPSGLFLKLSPSPSLKPPVLFRKKEKKKMQLSDIPRNPRRRNAENQMCWSPSSRDSREINDFTC